MTGLASSSAASWAICSCVGRAGQLQLESLALADARNLAEAEPAACAGDRVALRVVDLRLEHDVNDDSRHSGSVSVITSEAAAAALSRRDHGTGGAYAADRSRAAGGHVGTCVSVRPRASAVPDRIDPASTVAAQLGPDGLAGPGHDPRPDMSMQGVARDRQRCRTRRPPSRTGTRNGHPPATSQSRQTRRS